MKIKSLLFLFVFLLGSSSCSATASKRSFGEVVDDNVVAYKLRAKYIKDKVVKKSQIDVKVWKGTVTLKGVVDQQNQINRAIEIAEQQAGVQEVKAYLVLKGVVKPEPQKQKKGQFFSKIFSKKSTQHSKKNAEKKLSQKEAVKDSKETSSKQEEDLELASDQDYEDFSF
ncbi:MAG: BON domain-containing protein [Deltaproteobacteria bacterium]|nr:BON domain-containing protein [Deltaproteobacteria bacterium]